MKRIGQLLTQRDGFCHPDRRLPEWLPIARQEFLPGYVAAEGASVREGQVFELKRAPKRSNLRTSWLNAGSQPIVVLHADRQQNSGQLLFGEANRVSLRLSPKPVDRKAGKLLKARFRLQSSAEFQQVESRRLWRSRIHAPTIHELGEGYRRTRLRLSSPRIVLRVEVFHPQWPDGRDLRHILTGFCPVEVPCIAGKYDHCAWRIRLQLIGLEMLA